VEEFRGQARAWLKSELPPRASESTVAATFDVSVFRDLSHGDEAALIARWMAWQRRKYQAGYGAIAWPREFGGPGLTPAHQRAFDEEEAAFEAPDDHEVCRVTVNLVAPTIRVLGTKGQQERFIPAFLGGEELCCQLFSEPGAGSDLAGVGTKAVRDGDEWVLDGQKVWSSGAQFAQWGEAICRTDPSVPKHGGQTAFLVPLDAPGVEVRPIRQITGGASFNEVFLSGVRIPDSLRLGDVGAGWKVALTTLGFERAVSGQHGHVGGSWRQVLALARAMGRSDDPVVRQRLAHLYSGDRVRKWARVDSGPAGSVGKLAWTEWMREASDVVSLLLGPKLVADSGEWGTYGWTEHVLGAPGYRIAGGSDEIQRNIIGERVLGLPGEPRVDRDVPFSRVPR
jgi:alkylation response protein AidB-like acyl-CoA dehydrogenase